MGDWVEAFKTDAHAEGFRFVDRLVREWRDGTNQFSGGGERFVLGSIGDSAAGICGLNKDTYALDASTGRLRHLYVRPASRRTGVGRALVEELLSTAQLVFKRVRLRTDSAEADCFYRSLGFERYPEQYATHVFELRS